MKFLIMLLLVLVPAVGHGACKPKKSNFRSVMQIIEIVEQKERRVVKNRVIKAQAIIESANKFCLDAVLLAAIIAVESGFRQDVVNTKTKDYGMTQINEYNIKARKLSKKMLLEDINYNVGAGALILAEKKRFATREPTTWYCRYNVGTGAYAKIEKPCAKYVNKVNYYLAGRP